MLPPTRKHFGTFDVDLEAGGDLEAYKDTEDTREAMLKKTSIPLLRERQRAAAELRR